MKSEELIQLHSDHSLIDHLMIDHGKIRSVYSEIKKECERQEADNEFCLDTMESLRILILAHAKAEEMALYNICETLSAAGTPSSRLELQEDALEGYVEHGLVEHLLDAMVKFEEADGEWRANFNVLAELLDHHLREEEQDFFKKVKDKFHDDVLAELGEVYVQERDTILKNEITAASRPASRSRMKEMFGVETTLS